MTTKKYALIEDSEEKVKHNLDRGLMQKNESPYD